MTSKKIMGEIKRHLNGNMVTTNQIAEAFYKLMGSEHSVSGSQINDLAVKLERENGVSRHSSNCPCSTPKDKIEQLSAKSLEECYCKTSLSSREQDNLKKGFYTISLLDKIVFAINRDYFWNRLIKASGFGASEFHNIREAANLRKDSLGKDKIFTPSKAGRDSIRVGYSPNNLPQISSKAEERLKCIVLYYNAMYNNSQKEIVITSTGRSSEKQANLVYNSVYYAMGQLASHSMYTGNAGRFTEQEIKKGTPEQDIKDMLAKGIKEKRFTGFNHIDAPDNTADIGVLISNTWATSGNFPSTLEKFKRGGKFLDAQTLIYPAKGEKECHHLVILT